MVREERVEETMQSLDGGYLARLELKPCGVQQALVSRIIFS
jgi:hypothetical protein